MGTLEKIKGAPSSALDTLQKPLSQAGTDAQTAAAAVPAPEQRDASKIISDVVVKIAGSIATTLGLAGIVAVVGAAVVWTRFHEAGLPASQAVDVVPNNQLIVVGAAALIGYLAVGLVGVLVAFIFDPQGKFSRGSITAVVLLGLGGLAYAIFYAELDFWPSVCALIGLFVLLGAGCLVVANRTSAKFIPFGSAILVAVAVFGGALTFLRESELDRVQAGAVLRGADDGGLTGLYVADTDDRIYLARPIDSEPRALYPISRDDQTLLVIGPLESSEAASTRADELLAQLKRDARFESKTEPQLGTASQPRTASQP